MRAGEYGDTRVREEGVESPGRFLRGCRRTESPIRVPVAMG